MRFELLAPHLLTLRGQSQLIPAGTVIDADEIQGFAATPSMRPLDSAAYQALLSVCSNIRRMQRAGGWRLDTNCPGFAHSGAWPGGEFFKEPSQWS
jgi:hypothetical protein